MLIMEALENFSLRKLNTFGIEASANYFASISSIEELRTVLLSPDYRELPKLILGGGSNILLTQNFPGLIIKNNILGIEIKKTDQDHVYVRSGAGENWHNLVKFCLHHNFAGIENLSLIPGNVGASPIQNIGAYGVELKDIFHSLEAIDLQTGELKVFDKEACHFGYRDSIFKKDQKGRYAIVNVTLKLSLKPAFNISYGAIETELNKISKGISIQTISEAVCNIRRSKLPDPALIGNAGSFFKNPSIGNIHFENLRKNFPGVIGHPTPDGSVKLAAGWLIEQCGWKGKRIGNTGVHKDQALVLVNYGGAEGKEVYTLASEVKRSVNEKFGIDLEMEVNII